MPVGNLEAFDEALDRPTLEGHLDMSDARKVGVVLPSLQIESTQPIDESIVALTDAGGYDLGGLLNGFTGTYIEIFKQKALCELAEPACTWEFEPRPVTFLHAPHASACVARPRARW